MILSWQKEKAAQLAEASYRLAFIGRAMRLSAILDDGDARAVPRGP